MTSADILERRLHNAENRVRRLRHNPAPTFPILDYQEAATVVNPITILGDRSARLFRRGIADAGIQSLPGYNAAFSFNPATYQYTVNFNTESGIDYVVEGRDSPSSGGIVTAGSPTNVTVSTVLFGGSHHTYIAGASWLFRFVGLPEYAVDVLDWTTGEPFVWDAIWSYDGDRTISVTFTSDDDGSNPWYLMCEVDYSGQDDFQYISDGPFTFGTTQIMTIVLSSTPTASSFFCTLGTIPALVL